MDGLCDNLAWSVNAIGNVNVNVVMFELLDYTVINDSVRYVQFVTCQFDLNLNSK